ncbi:hypothetical protein [Actinophytocola sp.]|uniref:hypothetical protein n=1 Tax=Actinophytocola sp. TaxID=1872138 RepID=UPI002ED26316
MNQQHNEISVGGDVGGNVVAGNGNTVGAAPAPRAEQRPAVDGMAPRLGFVVDVVGFGHRDAESQAELQHRLDELVRRVLADLGIDPEDTIGSDSGDSRLAFLPAGVDWSRVLPTMISAMGERLGRDNRRYRDRMRLRMSIGTGLVGTGPLGFTGQLVVDLHRLVDSEVLRQSIRDHPDTDLVVLVSQALHDDVIRPGHLDPADFTPVTVTAKEFAAPAWLRLC